MEENKERTTSDREPNNTESLWRQRKGSQNEDHSNDNKYKQTYIITTLALPGKRLAGCQRQGHPRDSQSMNAIQTSKHSYNSYYMMQSCNL